MRKFLLFLSLSVILGVIATEAFAQTAKHRIKLVFPLGESAVTGKVCQQQHQTNDGCCEPPKEIYTYAPGATGCCESPNTIQGVASNQRCCTPLPADHIRWNQSPSNVCGNYMTCGTGAIPNAEKNACICDTGNGYAGTWQKDEGSGNGCVDNTCGGKMRVAGYDDEKFTVTGKTITYTGTMTVSSDLDLTGCNLVVNNASSEYALRIDDGRTLKADSVTGTSTAANGKGIYNEGNINTKAVTGKGGSFGIENNRDGTIEADTVTGTVTSNGSATIVAIENRGTIEAKSVILEGTITGTGTVYAIINDRDGKLLLTGNITATTISTQGNAFGVHNSGAIKANKVDSTASTGGTGGAGGIENFDDGTMEAETLIGTGATGIKVWDGTVKATTVTGTGTAYKGIEIWGGSLKATTITGSGAGTNPGIEANDGTIEASTFYYCQKTSGTLPGTRICISGCTCTN